jgi:hypothetical protein
MRRTLLLAVPALILAGAAIFFLSRPDPVARAAEFAAALRRETGLETRVVGKPELRGWFDVALHVPQVEIAGIGALDDLVLAADGTGTARAALWGRDGALALSPTGARFTASDLTIAFQRDTKRLSIATSAAGLPFALEGRAALGGLADLTVEWAGIKGTGGIDPTGGISLGGGNWHLDGRIGADRVFQGRAHIVDAALGEFDADLRLDGENFDVPDLRFAGGGGTLARQNGRWALDMRFAEVEIAKLADLLARGGDVLAGDLDLRARIGTATWKSGAAQGGILTAGRENGVWTIDELAVRDVGGASLRVRDGIVDLRSPDAQRFFDALGVPIARHLGELSLRGRIDPVAMRVAPLELGLAGQRMAGAILWRDGRLAAELAGERIDLDPFFLRALPRPAQRGPLLTRSQQAQATRAAQAPAPGPGGWSRVPLAFDLAGSIPLDLSLRARELIVGGATLGDALVQAGFGDDGIDVRQLSGSLWRGRFEANGKLAGGENPGFAAAFTVTDFELGELLTASGLMPVLRGPAKLAGRVESQGGTFSIWAGNLKGDATLSAPGAILDGLDLGAIARRYAAPGNPPDIAELARLAGRGGRSVLDDFDARLRIALGHARVERWRAAAAGATIDGSGQIDIGAWALDLVAEFAFAGKKSWRFAAQGPFANPRLNFQPPAQPASSGGAAPQAGSAARSRPAGRPASR